MKAAVARGRAARKDIVVDRPRLIRALEDAPGRVIVLRAPAGFGKTTLARQWVAGNRQSAWYRATAASSDVAALAVDLAEVMNSLANPAEPPPRLAVEGASPSRLANTLLDAIPDWPPDAWLVVDDYHLLSGSAPSEALIERLVEVDSISLLVASRARPTWATARRLLYGKVLELTQSALAMTPAEASEVFDASGMKGVEVASTAQGWPAVIGLAARTARAERKSVLVTQLPEELHQFFAEELFHHLPTQVQADLTNLAIAPRLDEELLSMLFVDRAEAFVSESMDAGFLAQVGAELEIHPLLREFLASKLPPKADQLFDEFGERLVRHYLDRGQLDEAFAVAERLHADHLLTLTFETGLDELLAAGRLTTLERWIAVARREHMQLPILDLAEAEIDLRTGRVQRACARAVAVAEAVEPDHPLHARAWFVAGRSANLDERGDDAVRFLRHSSDTSRNARDRFRALWSTFFVQMELEAAEEAEATLRLLEQNGDFQAEDKVRLEQARLVLAIRKGGVHENLARAETVRASMLAGVDPVVVTGFLHTLAHAYCLSARYEDADAVSDEVLSYATRSGLDFVVPHALCERAMARLGQRRFLDALADVEQAFDRAIAAGDVHSEMNSLSIAAKIYLCQHESERALSVLSGLWERPANRGMLADFSAVQALAFACSGDWTNARAAIRRSEEISSLSQGRILRMFVKAIVAAANGDVHARELFDAALAEAIGSGNFDAFVLAYRAYPDILKDVQVESGASAALARILERVDPGIAERSGFVPPRPRARTHKRLTNREAEVLGLIRQGLSNRQIAATLWLSESTVKLHVHHILDKLGARSRTEAAAVDDA